MFLQRYRIILACISKNIFTHLCEMKLEKKFFFFSCKKIFSWHYEIESKKKVFFLFVRIFWPKILNTRLTENYLLTKKRLILLAWTYLCREYCSHIFTFLLLIQKKYYFRKNSTLPVFEISEVWGCSEHDFTH